MRRPRGPCALGARYNDLRCLMSNRRLVRFQGLCATLVAHNHIALDSLVAWFGSLADLTVGEEQKQEDLLVAYEALTL